MGPSAALRPLGPCCFKGQPAHSLWSPKQACCWPGLEQGLACVLWAGVSGTRRRWAAPRPPPAPRWGPRRPHLAGTAAGLPGRCSAPLGHGLLVRWQSCLCCVLVGGAGSTGAWAPEAGEGGPVWGQRRAAGQAWEAHRCGCRRAVLGARPHASHDVSRWAPARQQGPWLRRLSLRPSWCTLAAGHRLLLCSQRSRWKLRGGGCGQWQQGPLAFLLGASGKSRASLYPES